MDKIGKQSNIVSLPSKSFLITVFSIFISGVFVNAIPRLPNLPSGRRIFIESLLIALFLIPELYLFLYRPLKLDLDAQEKTGIKLKGVNEYLEQLVKQRTRELKEFKYEARVALVESEERYRSLVRQSSEGVIIFDPMTRVVQEANNQICYMLGYNEQEIVGKRLEKIALMDIDFLEDNIKKMTMAGETVSGLRQYRHNDGSLVEVEVYASVIKYGQGKVVLANIRNVTDRIRAENALKESILNLKSALNETVNALIAMAEQRDPYTVGHQYRAAMLACAIAKEMNLPDEQIEGILISGKLHDIGKIYVPIEILNKPGRLTDVEMSIIKSHPKIGFEILQKIPFDFPVAKAVLQHHERIDGSGYPEGLCADEIMLEAKILCVADVVEAMASDRPYRAALGMERAIEEITKNRSVLYESRIVDACLNVINSKEIKLTFETA